MALIKKLKPNELLKLPNGDYIRNNGSHTVQLAYLKDKEVIENKNLEGVTNENCKSSKSEQSE